MTEAYAYAVCFILACLAIFQLALILGAPIGKFAWGGSHRILPTKFRIGSAVSVLLYLVFSALILDKAGVISIFGSDSLVKVVMWVVTVYFFGGVLINGISRSKYERNVMTTIALVLAILFFLVTIS